VSHSMLPREMIAIICLRIKRFVSFTVTVTLSR
jgi:hypothetical protein